MLIELIDAPEAILCYFCQFHGLHHVPVAGELVPDQITRVGVVVGVALAVVMGCLHLSTIYRCLCGLVQCIVAYMYM